MTSTLPTPFHYRGNIADVLFARRYWFIAALFVGLALRAGVFAYAWQWPISNEHGATVSPGTVQTSTDFATYIKAANILRSFSVETFIGAIEEPVRGDADMYLRNFIQPLLPGLILATGYGPGNTLPLSLVFLGVSCIAFVIWLVILRRTQLPGYWLLGFALLPTPLWFAVNMTLDSLLAVSVAVFYFLYFYGQNINGRVIFLTISVIAMIITRSNGAFIIGFLLADVVLFQKLKPHKLITALGSLLLIGVLLALLFLPLFAFEVSKAAVMPGLFGISNDEWLSGVFGSLPTALDRPLSWLSFAGAKILYFCGLRPSFGNTVGVELLVRAAPGLIMVPGIIYLIFSSEARHRLFFLCYFLPFFGHLPQDRYSLAIQPLLFMFGAQFFESLRSRTASALHHRKASSS